MKIHLVINDIRIDQEQILVGATDSERWQWDTENGHSGADSKTLLAVIVGNKNVGYNGESVIIHCDRTETILRPLVLAGIGDLFEIAWQIQEQKMTFEQADEKFFGLKIEK
jgi:hypothetical protein